MVKLTRNGICHDLYNTPYSFQTENTTFFFSSEFYRQKFAEEFVTQRLIFNSKMSNRYEMDLNLNELSDLILYRTIEKRGFLIGKDGEKLCLKDIHKLNGIGNAITKS